MAEAAQQPGHHLSIPDITTKELADLQGCIRKLTERDSMTAFAGRNDHEFDVTYAGNTPAGVALGVRLVQLRGQFFAHDIPCSFNTLFTTWPGRLSICSGRDGPDGPVAVTQTSASAAVVHRDDFGEDGQGALGEGCCTEVEARRANQSVKPWCVGQAL